MKLVIIFLGRSGGAVPYSFEMIKALLNENVEIFTVLSEYISNKKEWEVLEKMYDKLTLRFIETYSNKIEFVIDFLKKSSYRELERQINHFHPDAIYLPMISLNARKFKKSFEKYPLITTVHDYVQHPGMKNPISNFIFKSIEKKSTKFVVLTKKFRPLLSSKYLIPEKNIAYIPHANFTYYNLNGKQPEYSLKNRILFFGRITKYKGVSVLLEAMCEIITNNDKIILDIVGNGNLNQRDMDIIKNHSDRIRLINKWVSDDEVWDYFSSADLTILPYIEASQSGVVAISYSCGRTVIATATGGLEEQVVPGGGIVIPPKDSHALANAILALYNDGSLVEKNQQAFIYAKTKLTWSESAKKLLKLIKT